MKSQLLAAIQALQLPPNFLDQLLDELGGPGAVAEMTGRRGRVVRDGAGRPVFELRAKPETADMDSLNGEPQVGRVYCGWPEGGGVGGGV